MSLRGERRGRGLKELDTKFEPILLPFLKWAGGKRWLVSHIHPLLPAKYGTYIEPFVGSGAMFFAINPSRALLSDVNKELIATYIAIRENWQLVRRYLGEYSSGHCETRYYDERNRFTRSRYRNAARFIYLNRVC
jgi:DNA adenine methylase